MKYECKRLLLKNPIDIMMPIAAKDMHKAEAALQGIVAHSLNPIRQIYLVSPHPLSYQIQGMASTIWIDERTFPFSIDNIRSLFQKRSSTYVNATWYYQQLLKLYVYQVIPDLLEHVLILDSDFVFVQDTAFVADNKRGILAFGYPFKWLLGTKSYPKTVDHVHTEFAKKFLPGWTPQHSFSGMQHHMLLQREIIDDLFFRVEQHHEDYFWRSFINRVDLHKWNAASEYVLYHHFVLKYHGDKVLTRHLDACDVIKDSRDDACDPPLLTSLLQNPLFQAVGCHDFLDLRERIHTMDYIPADLKKKMAKSQRMMFKLILCDGELEISDEFDTSSAPILRSGEVYP